MVRKLKTDRGEGLCLQRAAAALPPVLGKAFCLLSALWLLGAFGAPGAQADPPGQLLLQLIKTDSRQVAFSIPIRAGQPFTLWFLHSYDRAFFAEHYLALAPGRIRLTHMTFKSNLNGEGFEYSDFHLRPDGVGELRNINEPREEVHFMMGSPDMANHTLILGGKRIPLIKFVKTGDLVSLVVAAHKESSGE